MGNRHVPAARQCDALSLFDIAAMIIHDRIPTSMRVPSSLDELVDWTEEATATSNHLPYARVRVIGGGSEKLVQFKPFVRKKIGAAKGEEEIVSQTDLDNFPAAGTFERVSYYEQNILVCVQPWNPYEPSKVETGPSEVICTLSGLDFCVFLRLLRRLAQLTELRGPLPRESLREGGPDEAEPLHECSICMDRPQDTVLPCLHGVCASCEARWVETHMDCPFCRKRYSNRRRMKREQWQLESWREGDVEKDMFALEQQLGSFWNEHASKPLGTNEMERYTRLGRSFNETIVDDDFVLLH